MFVTEVEGSLSENYTNDGFSNFVRDDGDTPYISGVQRRLTASGRGILLSLS